MFIKLTSIHKLWESVKNIDTDIDRKKKKSDEIKEKNFKL